VEAGLTLVHWNQAISLGLPMCLHFAPRVSNFRPSRMGDVKVRDRM